MSAADFGRIIHLSKRRERAKEDAEQQKKKLEDERKKMECEIADKFTSNVIQASDSSSTAGLLTLGEMKKRQSEALTAGDDVITGKRDELERQQKDKKRKAEVKESTKRLLSFADEEEDDEPIVLPKKRLGMDPSVDTSFLPDRDREVLMIRQKEDLVKEWRQLQDKEKNEMINVSYCYWDGSAHRKDMKVKKGDTIAQFLARALDALRKEFFELKPASIENLMFIKEDLIIPHFYTFLDFIATKMMGKTGPLWQFDAVGEVRLRQDAALDAGEAHPVKIVLRSWYEKNKHIYPASRWEAFVPQKEYKKTIDDLSTI